MLYKIQIEYKNDTFNTPGTRDGPGKKKQVPNMLLISYMPKISFLGHLEKGEKQAMLVNATTGGACKLPGPKINYSGILILSLY